ncbi:hypothetical protein Tco_0540856 [Tanacetum coccineum]
MIPNELNNVVEEEDGEWICFLGGGSSSGTKKYQGSNSSDGGNIRDRVKIAGGVIGSDKDRAGLTMRSGLIHMRDVYYGKDGVRWKRGTKCEDQRVCYAVRNSRSSRDEEDLQDNHEAIEKHSKEVEMMVMIKVKENVLDVATQVTSLENVQSRQRTTIKEHSLEEHEATIGKMKWKGLKMKLVL